MSWLMLPFASLESRDFRLLWFGQLGQASAMWAEQIARNWLTWQLTESATALGLMNLFRAIPLITLGLLGGVVADRFDKRKVLLAIQLWSLAIYILMAALILTGAIRLWHIYLTAFLLGAGMAMNQPVRTSFIPQLLGGKLLVNALSLNSIAINVTRLIGPAAIGFLIVVFNGNVGPAYVISSVLYAVVLLTTLMIRSRGRSAGSRSESMLQELLEGFRYIVLENRMVLSLIVLALGPLAFGFSYMTLLPVLVTNVLHMNSSGYGALQSVSAVGGLVGGLTLASMGSIPHKGRVMLASGLLYGSGVMLLGGTSAPVMAFIVLVVVGGAQTIFRAANNSTLLEITPSRLQGRVVSITFIDMGIQSLASIFAGSVTDTWGVGVGLYAIGAVCLVIVFLVAVAVPAVRKL